MLKDGRGDKRASNAGIDTSKSSSAKELLITSIVISPDSGGAQSVGSCNFHPGSALNANEFFLFFLVAKKLGTNDNFIARVRLFFVCYYADANEQCRRSETETSISFPGEVTHTNDGSPTRVRSILFLLFPRCKHTQLSVRT